MEIKESQCGSVNTLLKKISELSVEDHSIFFRGHANKKYLLDPSLYRDESWYSNEDKMIREILIRCPSDFSSMKTCFEKLVKMQHYDLPTRLLDLTENPLVALYFACVGESDKGNDGEIIFFKIPKKEIRYFDSDTVSVVSNVAWAKPDFEIKKPFDTEKTFHKENNIHAQKLMHDIRQEKPHFRERIKPEHIQSVVCVKPQLDNPRIIRQEGVFLLFGIDGNKHNPAKIPENWVVRVNESRIIIKSADKPKILKQLASIGISKAKLFPEIDMVAQFIKNDFGLDKQEFISSIKDYSPPNIKFSLGI
ncbi:FRG domain-containing protein [Psychromonas sp. SA13A]|uniref:FRG domain-containing protein n=1 Tax=Psychromonas sp. SA13A TaxID=2686346 RepID=UPI0014094623|nr:FRG domain-containing protein [Psychromonas sp. SA13A]